MIVHLLKRRTRALIMVQACLAMALMLLASAERSAAVEFGNEGFGAGQFSELGGLAAGPSPLDAPEPFPLNGDIYAVDKINRRVNAFSDAGTFVGAWGWGVDEGQQQFEVCTSACMSGLGERPGAGEFAENVGGIAINSTGEIYVTDQANSRVEEFTPTSGIATLHFQRAFGREVNASAVAQRQAEELAKELITITSEEEDVCVGAIGSECQAGSVGNGEAAFEFGQRGTPIAVDATTGDVYVGSRGQVQEFEEDGAYVRGATIENATKEPLGQVEAIAVGGPLAPNIYVIAEGAEKVLEYSEAKPGELSILHELVGSGAESLAYNEATSTVFVEHEGNTPNGRLRIFEYAASGLQTEAFPAGESQTAVVGTPAIAWDNADQEIYANTGIPRRIRSVSPPSPGPLVISGASESTPRGAVKLSAKVDPEGAETVVHFEYESAPGVFTQISEASISGEGGGGELNFNEETLETAAHLAAGTSYNYRIRATNTNGVSTQVRQFTTLPAAEIAGESAASVTSSSATLEATLNPLDEPSSWWFEYAPAGSTEYVRTSVAQVSGLDEGVAISAHIDGLSPHTNYHFRLAVENGLAVADAVVRGTEVEFTTTEATVGRVALPDGRAWEMISPPHKLDASFEGITEGGGLTEASANGESLTYLATAATEAAVNGEPSPEWSQMLAVHGSGGWSSRDIATRHEQEWGVQGGHAAEYFAFSDDLSAAVVEPKGETLLGDATERTPYLRRRALCEGEHSESEATCYLPLMNTEDVTSGVKWGGPQNLFTSDVNYRASTSDLSHIVVSSSVPLTAGASGDGLYEWSAGHLALISTLPAASGQTPGEAACAQVSLNRNRNVISTNGDRVVWENNCEGAHLYMHEMESDRTIQLDVGSSGKASASFQDANVDDSRVFFTDTEKLIRESQASEGKPDLYVYEANPDTDSNPGVLGDVTLPVHVGESADVMGVIPGASEDGSLVYLVAGGVLTTAVNERGETAQSGEPNLYMMSRSEAGGKVMWNAEFITTLSGEDSPDWGQGVSKLAQLTAYVSANGQWLTFVSDRSLTGYDNHDAASGEPDEEVYLYDATGAGRLVCASCNPSGARPQGVERTSIVRGSPLVDVQKIWVGRWLAGTISAWSGDELGVGTYPPRYLSNDGRLFFDSNDALVPQDVNNTWDVYEYEPPGVGGCSMSAPTYSPAQLGCIGLISSGTSPEESVFLDASEGGNDAFFLTAAKLVSQDTDDGYDVYDAHVCGVGWECPAPVATTGGTTCEAVGSCKAPGAPGPASSSPSSSTYEGAGNLKPVRKAKPQAKKKGSASSKARCRAKARRVKGARKRRSALMRCDSGKRHQAARSRVHGHRHASR